jgi:thiol:disulfide interchange protein DsbD
MRLRLAPFLSCLALLAPAAPAAAANALDALKDLGRDLGGVPKLLPPEQAFKVTARVKDANTLVAEFSPAMAYYLYREKFRFALQGAQGVGIAAVRLPKGEHRDGIRADATFGRVEIYRKPVVAEIELGREGAVARRIVLEAGYQGCSEKGVCYPPLTRRFELLLPAVN